MRTTIVQNGSTRVVETQPPGVVTVNVGRVGPRGPAGETGAKGDPGDPGEQGVQGEKGDTGDTGPAGADGRTWLSGSGAPSNALGEDGDFYLDTAASAYYGPKAAGAWPAGVSLVGPQGEKGDQGDAGPQGQQGATGSAGPGLTFTESMWLSILFVQGTNVFPWTGAAISGGSITSVLGPTQAPGANRLSSATAASGYRVQTAGQLQGAAGLAQRMLLLPWGDSAVTIRAGFHDSSDSSAPTDGAYFQIAGLTLTGRCRNNTSESATVGSLTLTAGVWYVLDIDYLTSSSVRFVVSDLATGSLLFSETLSGSNVPNTTTRTFVHGIVAHDSDASSAKAMCDLAGFAFGPARPPYCPVPA